MWDLDIRGRGSDDLSFLPHFLRLHQLRTMPLQTLNPQLEARRVIKYWPRDAAYMYLLPTARKHEG